MDTWTLNSGSWPILRYVNASLLYFDTVSLKSTDFLIHGEKKFGTMKKQVTESLGILEEAKLQVLLTGQCL